MSSFAIRLMLENTLNNIISYKEIIIDKMLIINVLKDVEQAVQYGIFTWGKRRQKVLTKKGNGRLRDNPDYCS